MAKRRAVVRLYEGGVQCMLSFQASVGPSLVTKRVRCAVALVAPALTSRRVQWRTINNDDSGLTEQEKKMSNLVVDRERKTIGQCVSSTSAAGRDSGLPVEGRRSGPWRRRDDEQTASRQAVRV